MPTRVASRVKSKEKRTATELTIANQGLRQAGRYWCWTNNQLLLVNGAHQDNLKTVVRLHPANQSNPER